MKDHKININKVDLLEEEVLLHTSHSHSHSQYPKLTEISFSRILFLSRPLTSQQHCHITKPYFPIRTF